MIYGEEKNNNMILAARKQRGKKRWIESESEDKRDREREIKIDKAIMRDSGKKKKKEMEADG